MQRKYQMNENYFSDLKYISDLKYDKCNENIKFPTYDVSSIGKAVL